MRSRRGMEVLKGRVRRARRARLQDAPMEAILTYRVRDKKRIKAPRNKRDIGGFSAMTTPKKVATPFPPWNLSHRGKQCPTTQAIATKGAAEGRIIKVIATGIVPFRISAIRVMSARRGVVVLRTLVAPMLPEPFWRISSLPVICVRRSPKGILPKRYAAIRRGMMVMGLRPRGGHSCVL